MPVVSLVIRRRRREDENIWRLVVELGEAELVAAPRAIASKRYGLPTEAEIEALTARANGDRIVQSD